MDLFRIVQCEPPIIISEGGEQINQSGDGRRVGVVSLCLWVWVVYVKVHYWV